MGELTLEQITKTLTELRDRVLSMEQFLRVLSIEQSLMNGNEKPDYIKSIEKSYNAAIEENLKLTAERINLREEIERLKVENAELLEENRKTHAEFGDAIKTVVEREILKERERVIGLVISDRERVIQFIKNPFKENFYGRAEEPNGGSGKLPDSLGKLSATEQYLEDSEC